MPKFDNVKVIITTDDNQYIKGEATVDFEVFCGTCGKGLCNQSEGRSSRNRKFPQVTVEVCRDCLNKSLIDEYIAPVVELLNKKGYKTEFGCSGHTNKVGNPDNNCYIRFDKIYRFKQLPDGFQRESSNYKTVIRKFYNTELTEKALFLNILDTMKILYEWAEILPGR